MTLSINPLVNHAIEVLNEIVALDPTVMTALIKHRVPCAEAFIDHPTVQVGLVDDDHPELGYEVGLLGIINGLFGVDERGWGHIYAHTDAAGNVIKFSRRTE